MSEVMSGMFNDFLLLDLKTIYILIGVNVLQSTDKKNLMSSKNQESMRKSAQLFKI